MVDVTRWILIGYIDAGKFLLMFGIFYVLLAFSEIGGLEVIYLTECKPVISLMDPFSINCFFLCEIRSVCVCGDPAAV